MNDIKPESPSDKIVLSAEKARGARPGRPVLYVLIGAIAGATIAVAVVHQLV